ncbi:MAG TPA: hypothetical protein ENK11_00270 [Phycisphaerales bacterium]|nr:hypothetical protein [Phycisphaerales bacterium]
MRRQSIAAISLAAAASFATAQNTVLTLDLVPPSDGDASAEYFTFLGTDNDSGSADSATGTIIIETDDFSAPTLLILHDLSITLDPTVAFAGMLDAGMFLGSGTWSLNLDGMMYPLSEPPITGDSVGARGFGGVFEFPDLPLTMLGDAATSYDFIGLAPVTIDPPLDLSAQDNADAMLTNVVVSSDGETVTLTGTLAVMQYTIPWEPALVETRLDATVNITAQAPDPTMGANVCSRADIAEPCGLLDLADILAFVNAFANQDPIADMDNSGLFDLADVLSFVTLFQKGGCFGDTRGKGGFGYDCYSIGMNFDEGDATYALGEHGTLTAGFAVGGTCLMLGFSATRRRIG